VNVINGWDAGDIIRLCGQHPNFYHVTKIEFISADNDFNSNDVLIALTDATLILIKNAAADFQQGISTFPNGLEFVGANVDDFQHVDHVVDEELPLEERLCEFDCPDPVIAPAPLSSDWEFCDEESQTQQQIV
jgi:hypothetical protein